MIGIGRVPRRLVTVAALALCSALAPAGAASAATTADRAATHAYLEAQVAFYSAAVRQSAASLASVHAFAVKLGSECPGVLAGEPTEDAPEAGGPRARGEHERSELQEQDIQGEIAAAVRGALDEPFRAAGEAFLARVETLSWSDARIEAAMRTLIALERAGREVPPVCADMKAWAQSGYHRLSAASQAFAVSEEARGSAERHAGGSPEQVLAPTEGPPEKALAKRVRALSERYDAALRGDQTFASLRRALGEPASEDETAKMEPLIGRGRTAAGETFAVRLDRHSRDRSCRIPVSVEFENRAGDGSSSGVCLTMRVRSGRLPEGCGGRIQNFEVPLPSRVWSVRLQLSNGRSITTPVVRVSRRDGGPAAIYVQSVGVRHARPVSLTELDRQGRVVGVLKAEPCGPPPGEPPPPSPPHFVPLANATTPQGEAFKIEASIFHPDPHETEFRLSVGIGVHGSEEAETLIGGGPGKPKAFGFEEAFECAPRAFSVIYGILAAPGDSVTARTAAGPVTMTKVELVPALHSGGPLVYGVFAGTPLELIVRAADGSVLYTESLVAKAKEDTEFCEGFAES